MHLPPPVVVPPAPAVPAVAAAAVAATAVAAQPQPQQWQPQLDVSVCSVLSIKAARYFDTFDLPGETPTSSLLPRISFPTPSLTGPLPVESFEYIDPAEWAAFDISTLADMTFHEGPQMTDHWTQSENMSTLQLWHGTVLGAAIGMIGKGGFIPGPGKCRKNSRKVKCAFCATSFAESFEKGMGHQLDYAEDAPDSNKKLNMMCMPVVVELQALDWRPRPTHMHGSKYCFEAPPGFAGVLPGVIIKKLYINKVLVKNFNGHKDFRPELEDPYMVRVCGQNPKKFQIPLYQATCGRILHASEVCHQSNTGIWYCGACVKFRVHEGSYVYSLPNEQSNRVQSHE